MKIKIHYYSGAGNLFSVIDNRSLMINDNELPEFAKLACSKFSENSISTEGLIVIENSDDFPFQVKFFNPDGSSGMMCGNGARCAIAFATQLGMLENIPIFQSFQFQLAEFTFTGRILENSYQVDFPFPKIVKNDLKIDIDNYHIKADFIDVGTPHFLIDYDMLNLSGIDFDDFDLINFAKPIRYNKNLFPDGANISIFKIENQNLVHLRTYERGVESETGACGTASVSLGYLLFSKMLCNSPIKIIPTSQIPLTIHISNQSNIIILEGPAGQFDNVELEY